MEPHGYLLARNVVSSGTLHFSLDYGVLLTPVPTQLRRLFRPPPLL